MTSSRCTSRRRRSAVTHPLPSIPPLLFLLLSMITTTRAVAMLNPMDFLALQEIHSSLEDTPGSNFLLSWDFSSDPCSFPGVLCNPTTNRVVSLALGDPRAGAPGLTGKLHPSFSLLSELTDLSLVPGRVYGPIPSSLSLLRRLRFLALSENFLSGTIPASLSSLPSIQTLDLSFNLLSGSIPPPPPSLSSLILSHNRLSGTIPASIGGNPRLLRLDLKHNHLAGEIPPLPQSLRYLALSSNNLSGEVRNVLPRLRMINYLDLSSNQLSGEIPGEIFGFDSLSVLLLQRNRFSGEVRPEGKVGIGRVDLSYNRLTGAVPEELATVESLYLNSNRFTGAVPMRFVERLMGGSGLQVLYLQHNFLTGIEISPAAKIPGSAAVCLRYNCMVPPAVESCPGNAGEPRSRSPEQCPEWRG